MTTKEQTPKLYNVSVKFEWDMDIEANNWLEAINNAWKYHLRDDVQEYIEEKLLARRIRKPKN